jgi:hypothetical protein
MLTEEELKKANDDAITVILFIVFCLCVSAVFLGNIVVTLKIVGPQWE